LLFNSLEFFLFLVPVLCLYYALPHRAQNRMLLVASYVFYGWWDWRFLSLLALSSVIDFFCARAMDRSDDPQRRRRLLTLSLVTNLGILGFFKYFDFFAASAVELVEQLGFEASLPLLNLILPVGISFYTFQSLAYTIDVYRGQTRPARHFLDFALYVAFFPQLVAGPIERSRQLLPQLEQPRRVNSLMFAEAGQLLLLGYFKKVCIADGVAPYVERAFADPAALSAPELWLSLYLFAIQIYADFSGYTDIARGVALLLGIRLMVNFRQPYLSISITEFWQRWHISLSSWLRDYVYIPLGGNRRGRWQTYRNLMATMLLGGLWHGASWQFVIWGGLHGLALATHRAITGRSVASAAPEPHGSPWRVALKVLLTFHVVCLLWVFFRAESAAVAWSYLVGLVQFSTDRALPATEFVLAVIGYFVLVGLVDWPCWRRDAELPISETWPVWARSLAVAMLVVAISLIGESSVRPFVYFQF